MDFVGLVILMGLVGLVGLLGLESLLVWFADGSGGYCGSGGPCGFDGSGCSEVPSLVFSWYFLAN